MTFLTSRMLALRIAAAGLLSCLAVAHGAEPTQEAPRPAPPVSISLQQGGLLQVCEGDAHCSAYRHPAAAGKLRDIVFGNFVDGASASWIALGEHAVSLCYLNAPAGAITCSPVANGAEFAKATRISYLSFQDGTHTLKFSARNGNEASWEASYSPYQFMAGLSAAADLLHRHAVRNPDSNAMPGNPASADASGGDLCAISENGGMTCTGAAAPLALAVPLAPVALAVPLAAAAPIADAAAPADPNAIATVETGSSEPPSDRHCMATMNDRVKKCDALRATLGEKSRLACLNAAETQYEECTADPRPDTR